MPIQTRQVTVNIFDNDGEPLENARVEIRLVGLGNEPGGAVSPGIQTQFTDATGTTVFELWENRFDYSDTYYVVSSWNPVTGAQIHRREAFAVPDYDADLQELLGMALAGIDPTAELLNQINAIKDQSVVASERAETSAVESADSATAAAASVTASGENAAAAESSANNSSGYAVAASNSAASAQGFSNAAAQSAQEAAEAMYSKINLSEKGAANGVATLGPDSIVPEAQLPDFIKSEQRGVANGVATLGPNALIPPEQLPSYVDDVLEFDTYADLPVPGETGKIYIVKTAGNDGSDPFPANQQFRWSGTAYIKLVASPGTTDNVVEGLVNLYFTATRAINSVLTGFVAATADFVVSSTDTAKGALQKIQGRLNQLGTASNANTEDFATAAQGEAADSAIQLDVLNTRLGTGGNLGNSATRDTNIDIDDKDINKVMSIGTGGVNRGAVPITDFNQTGGGSKYIAAANSSTNGRPPNMTWCVGFQVTRLPTQGESAQLLIGTSSGGLQYRAQFSSDQTAWKGWREARDSGNTAIDSNGFLKNSSPITQLYADHVENNDQAEDVTLQKESTGVYQLLTERCFATKGWYIETPKDANGNIKVFVQYEENSDGILIKTFEPDYSNGRATAGNPIDIPEGRWIDVRMTYTDAEIAAQMAAEEAMAAELAAQAEAEAVN